MRTQRVPLVHSLKANQKFNCVAHSTQAIVSEISKDLVNAQSSEVILKLIDMNRNFNKK